MEPTTEIIRDHLQRAADAHHFHELKNGPDTDWPAWYAEHMARTLAEGGYTLSKIQPSQSLLHESEPFGAPGGSDSRTRL